MKQYILKQIGDNEPIGKYATKAEAADVMGQIIDENNDDLDSDDKNYLTAFDFRLEVVECQEVNETITKSDYEVEQVYETKIIDVFKVATNEEEDGSYF